MRTERSGPEKGGGMGRRAAISVSAVLILAAVLMLTALQRQDPGCLPEDYEVSSLDMRVAVGRDHTYEVEEFISVDIPETLRKMELPVPDGPFRMKDLMLEDGKAGAFRRDSGRYVIIKDPDLLTEGHHRYRIRFRLLEKADRIRGRDVFSFDVLPKGWKKPVFKVHALLWFPYGFPLDGIRCCSGEDPDVRLTVKIEKQSRSYTLGGRRIPEDYSLRLEADLPDGYWE